MKNRPLLIVALFTLPAWLGLALYFALEAQGASESVLSVRYHIDPGRLALVSGVSLSVVLLAVYFIRRVAGRRAEVNQRRLQIEASQMRRRFLAQLDHELKNPLTALRAEIAYLADEVEGERYARIIADMDDQVDRLGRLVSDLRKLAEIEDAQIERQPIDMGELIGEVMEAIEGHPDYNERQVRLQLLQDPWLLPRVDGDRGLLWLTCYNLLDNALKFTPPGALIEVRVFENHPWLIVDVIDNGPGISAGDLPHIFEELYRGTNARGRPGSGLGLALVRTVASLHGGSVHVRSQPGRGTVFTLRLPVAAR